MLFRQLRIQPRKVLLQLHADSSSLTELFNTITLKVLISAANSVLSPFNSISLPFYQMYRFSLLFLIF